MLSEVFRTCLASFVPVGLDVPGWGKSSDSKAVFGNVMKEICLLPL